MDISIRRTTQKKPRPPASDLGWGQYFTDHMFLMDYEPGRGWHNPRIEPYGPLTIDPAAAVLHYAQELFDGFKAIRGEDDKVRLFRPDRHCARLAEGSVRMCIPPVPTDAMLQAVLEFVRVDQDWVPSQRNAALYLRPTLIGTEPFLGVRPSRTYTFFIIGSPVGAYYAEGFNPVSIWVEQECVRAARGGLGAVKAGANYAASLYAAERAKKHGYSQVLWLDAAEHKYLEEVGTMNLFVGIDGTFITPPLEGSILEGVTRNSIITLLRDWNYEVVERRLSIDEIQEAHTQGRLNEIFGCGTGAVISPVGELGHKDKRLSINDRKPGPVSQRVFEELTGIQQARIPDTRGWLVPID
ncbi:branched-chain amino acid aminotransferase [Pendulispora albinea]|uniref:Branched-chain-amino-acid aminotransferase n=1 Tax=Pendulispora albinea TaxID=2741071 RepID=A0ABZ2LZD1_9BACT